MQRIDMNRLNHYETELHHKILAQVEQVGALRIIEAASLSGCATSTISKYVQKIGFQNYKQYMHYLTRSDIPMQKEMIEHNRITSFLEEFQGEIVSQFIALLGRYQNIIIFGYGPSFICAQYFEYKLRLATNKKTVLSAMDDSTVEHLLDEQSLLIIFSATGKFASFERLQQASQQANSGMILVVDEYHPALLQSYPNILFLSRTTQPNWLKPYEKSRSLFFIFIEEVLLQLLRSVY